MFSSSAFSRNAAKAGRTLTSTCPVVIAGTLSVGMIICHGQLDSIVPLENASMPGRVVAQWDKDDCEELGIIKVDLLGLGMMSVLQDTIALTCARGHEVDLAQLPQDDPQTFAL